MLKPFTCMGGGKKSEKLLLWRSWGTPAPPPPPQKTKILIVHLAGIRVKEFLLITNLILNPEKIIKQTENCKILLLKRKGEKGCQDVLASAGPELKTLRITSVYVIAHH